MAHIKPEQISDLKETLEKIRGLENLKEKSLGTFYYKSTPFLHFHTKEDRRWAHVKTTDGAWKEIVIPFKATVTKRKQFLNSIIRMHKAFFKK